MGGQTSIKTGIAFMRAEDRTAYNVLIDNTTVDGRGVVNLGKGLEAHDNRACPGVITQDEFESFAARVNQYQTDRPLGASPRWTYSGFELDTKGAIETDRARYLEKQSHSVLGKLDQPHTCIVGPSPIDSK